MFKYLNARYQIAQIKMLLAAANINACLLVSSSEFKCPNLSVKVLEIPNDSYEECLSLITEEQDLQLKVVDSLFYGTTEQCLVTSLQPPTEPEQSMSASEFLKTKKRVSHLNICSIDTKVRDLARAPHIPYLKALDLSRLQIDDSTITELLSTARLTNLRWLDLSGNAGITIHGVKAICDSIAANRLPNLDCLDLIGTAYDASPYVDGHCWRISEFALELAKEYGYQRWMMLGSKIPELANRELLTSQQRDPLASRFKKS